MIWQCMWWVRVLGISTKVLRHWIYWCSNPIPLWECVIVTTFVFINLGFLLELQGSNRREVIWQCKWWVCVLGISTKVLRQWICWCTNPLLLRECVIVTTIVLMNFGYCFMVPTEGRWYGSVCVLRISMAVLRHWISWCTDPLPVQQCVIVPTIALLNLGFLFQFHGSDRRGVIWQCMWCVCVLEISMEVLRQ